MGLVRLLLARWEAFWTCKGTCPPMNRDRYHPHGCRNPSMGCHHRYEPEDCHWPDCKGEAP